MFQSWEIHFGIGAARMLVRLFPTAQGSERRASNSNYNCEYVSHKGGYTVWNRERLAELVRHSRWSSPSKLRYILRHSQRGFRVAVFDLPHAPSLFLYMVNGVPTARNYLAKIPAIKRRSLITCAKQ